MSTPETLGKTAFGGAIHTGTSQAVRLALLIAATIVVARLLTPEDFGVMAMAAPVLAFVMLFQELGLGTATIQAKEVSPAQSSSLFWVNLGASTAFALLLLAASPLVGWFYGDARAGQVTAASAAILLLSATAIQHHALLARELRFRTMGRIVIAAAIANFAATVALAWWLRSFWAIFLGNLAGVAVQVAMTWTLQRWRPERRPRLRGAGRMLRFGGSVAGFDLLNYFSRNLDNVLIGRVWGAAPLGLYERSYSLMVAPLQMVNAPLARVMLPVLSRLQDEPVRYRHAYLSTLRGLLLATAPGAALAIGASEQLMPLLLGPRWAAASPIFFWLAIGCLYQPLGNALGWLFTSKGRGRALLIWGAVSSLTSVAAFAIGLPWGPAGVAMAYVLVGAARMPLLIGWATGGTAVSAGDVARVAAPYLVAAAATVAAVKVLADVLAPAWLVVLGLAGSYALAVIALAATPSGRRFLAAMRELASGKVAALLRRAG